MAIDEGKIVSIAKDVLLPTADKVIDCKGNLALPGGIDFHVHLMDLGYAYREDWRTGTESAAAGGTTFVVGIGHTNPPSTTRENLKKIVETAKRKAIVDFTVNGSVTSHNLEELPKLADEGVSTFGEIYMAESIPELEMVGDGVLLEAFKIIRDLNCLAGVHAEDWEIISYLTEKLKRAGRKDPLAHPESRPDIAEMEAISRALLLARRTGVRLHIFHLTTKAGIDLIEKAKKSGQDISCEACTHHLLFKTEDMKKYGPYLKCNPPIRSEENRRSLWEGLTRGTIDMVSTDHWPLTKSDKEVGWKNIWKAGAGMPGVETRMPLMFTYGVQRKRISMRTFLRVTSENPAKRLGLYPRKGVIAVGSDADLTVLDLKKKTKIKAEKMHTKCQFTPYEGWEVVGMPSLTLVRGEVVMEGGEIKSKPGYGTYVRRD
ncbi:MAG: dihydroorotase family protein [Aigarchaeota archaeon]|nr:dihydroorotase family protein [Aigarchaeota archaeon]